MGKPWFGIDNYLWREDTQITTSSSHSEYPVSNLGLKHLWPGWRSDRKPLLFDGYSDYLRVEDHSDFQIIDDLILYVTFMCTDVSSANYLLYKSDDVNGYYLAVDAGVLRFMLKNSNDYYATYPVSEDKIYRVIAIWNSVTGFKVFINGEEVPVSIQGSAFSSIGIDSTDLIIGGPSAATRLTGFIFECGVANYTTEKWHYPNAATCKGYWLLDNWSGSVISDSSGNGHNLSSYTLSSEDNQTLKGAHWIQGQSSTNVVAPVAVVDRRHNISTGSEIGLGGIGINHKLYRIGPYTTSVNHGQPVVIQAPGGDTDHWWLEMYDNDLSSQSYEIPLVFIGSKHSLSRSYLRGFEHQIVQKGTSESAGSGSLSRYVAGEEANQYTVTFYADAADRQVLGAAIRYSAQGYPVVFCPDEDAPEKTIFCHVEDPYGVHFRNVYTGLDQVELTLTEVS